MKFENLTICPGLFEKIFRTPIGFKNFSVDCPNKEKCARYIKHRSAQEISSNHHYLHVPYYYGETQGKSCECYLDKKDYT